MKSAIQIKSDWLTWQRRVYELCFRQSESACPQRVRVRPEAIQAQLTQDGTQSHDNCPEKTGEGGEITSQTPNELVAFILSARCKLNTELSTSVCSVWSVWAVNKVYSCFIRLRLTVSSLWLHSVQPREVNIDTHKIVQHSRTLCLSVCQPNCDSRGVAEAVRKALSNNEEKAY